MTFASAKSSHESDISLIPRLSQATCSADDAGIFVVCEQSQYMSMIGCSTFVVFGNGIIPCMPFNDQISWTNVSEALANDLVTRQPVAKLPE